jgi:hypothetical protein
MPTSGRRSRRSTSSDLVLPLGLYLAGQVLNAVKWWLLGSSVGLVRPLMDYTRFYFGGGGWTTRRVKRRGWGCGSRSTAA